MRPHRLLDRMMPRPAGRHRNHRPRMCRLSLEALEDRTLLAGFTVTSPNGDTGPGTLYDAIAHADADTTSPGVYTIDFAIQGTGPFIIATSPALARDHANGVHRWHEPVGLYAGTATDRDQRKISGRLQWTGVSGRRQRRRGTGHRKL